MKNLKPKTLNLESSAGFTPLENVADEAGGKTKFLRDDGIKQPSSLMGFTIIEVIVVLGIFALIAGIAGVLTTSDLQKGSLRAERDLAVSLLQKTRARAMANINQETYGVHLDLAGNRYIIFQGVFNPLAVTNEYVSVYSSGVQKTPANFEIKFNQLDGSVSTPGTMSLNSGASDITINSEGRIFWTN